MVQDPHTDAAWRLRTAMLWTDGVFDAHPPKPDLDPGTALANAWALITIAYSGIEQSLKYLLAQRSGLTVDDWLKKEPARKHHDIHKLFDVLEANDKDVLRESYSRFRSLHMYIEEPCLESYLRTVSHEGQGYQRWRYALVETSVVDIPRNSIDAMMSIWRTIVYLIEHRQFGKDIPMPDVELCDELWASIDIDLYEIITKYDDHFLNVCAQLLWEGYRRRGSPELLQAIHEWEESLYNKGGNVLAFVARARGISCYGRGIFWDEEAFRFKDIPWNMGLLEADEEPNNAYEVPYGEARRDVLREVYSSGFEVKERAHDRRKAEDDYRRCGKCKWQCTVMAEKTQPAGEKTTLRVWEHIFHTDPYIWVVVENDTEHLLERLPLIRRRSSL